MFNKTAIISFCMLGSLLMTGCQQQSSMDEENAVYYWRTTWKLDSIETDFLTRYHINKV